METDKQFLTIKAAASATGLSQTFIRAGCRSGTIPHVLNGTKYLVNVQAMLERLSAQSREQVNRIPDKGGQ